MKKVFCMVAVALLVVAWSSYSFAYTYHTQYTILDDASGGDCSQIGVWDASTKTCTLTQDVGLTSTPWPNTSYGIGLDNNVTLDGAGHRIYPEDYGSFGSAVVMPNVSGATVKNVFCDNFSRCILLSEANNNVVEDNSTRYGTGVALAWSKNNVVRNNYMRNGYTAIWLMYGADGNEIYGNTTRGTASGIALAYANDNVIRNNDFSNVMGLELYYYAQNNRIYENTFRGWYTVVRFGDPIVRYNEIYNNNFIRTSDYNNYPIISLRLPSEGPYNWFNLDKPIGGNYWSTFDEPSEGCTDVDGDDICDAPFTFDDGIDELPYTKPDAWLIVRADVDVKPDTLNINSKGGKNSVTVYIETADYDVADIDPASITLSSENGSVQASASPVAIGDYDSDGIADLMVKFDRQEVIAVVGTGEDAVFNIAGSIGDRSFKGADSVRIRRKSK